MAADDSDVIPVLTKGELLTLNDARLAVMRIFQYSNTKLGELKTERGDRMHLSDIQFQCADMINSIDGLLLLLDQEDSQNG